MYANMMDTIGFVSQFDPEVGQAMNEELGRQRRNLELIASENLVSPAVMAAMGSALTNKYAEGLPHKRYYGGCEYVDVVEEIAIERACKLFGAKYANVQPHSGAQANTAVYFALLQPGDTVMGMSLAHGGHLTHGSPDNISGVAQIRAAAPESRDAWRFWSQKKRPPKNIPSAITKKMTERMRPSAKPAFPPCLRAAGERNSFFSNKSLISKRKYPQKTIAERRSHTTGTPKAAQR